MRLFAYGTLQLTEVQLATFGRELVGRPDSLPGYRATMLKITDPDVVAVSGSAEHPIVTPTDGPAASVAGTVFEITADELLAADAYEVEDYHRVEVRLASGVTAWVYLQPAPTL